MNLRTFASRVLNRLLYPLLPRSNRLPFLYLLQRLDGSAEPELISLDALCRDRRVAIDVGANEGLFSYRLSKLFQKVHAFEVNQEVLENLIAYQARNIEIHSVGLSSESSELTLHIPVLKGRPLTGWASLTPGNCPDTSEHLTKRVQTSPLDALCVTEVSFIKIDVEGHEMEVLKGARQTISRDRPLVLLEVREQNRCEIEAFFGRLGYRAASFEEFAGVKGSPANQIFAPN